jgi:hypothetical protein
MIASGLSHYFFQMFLNNVSVDVPKMYQQGLYRIYLRIEWRKDHATFPLKP